MFWGVGVGKIYIFFVVYECFKFFYGVYDGFVFGNIVLMVVVFVDGLEWDLRSVFLN